MEEVKIGNQIWTKKNLDVDVFRNGDSILQVKSYLQWSEAIDSKKPAWCYYEYDVANGKKWGKLYNWFAVNDQRGLAPVGWHIPSDKDWDLLTYNLGGADNAGDKMKITNEWEGYNETNDDGESIGEFRSDSATNESGFSAYPGGGNTYRGLCISGNDRAYWWSSTKDEDDNPIYRLIYATYSDLDRSVNTECRGASVRCLKD